MKLFNQKIAWLAGVGIAGILASSSLLVAQAAEFIVPHENGNVTVSSTEQHKNLYVVGGNVLINSNTSGDLYVAGGNVTIEGNVEGDLTLAGGSAYINGSVGGDVRVAGGDITINNTVGGDLVVAGGTVIVNEKAIVNGDVFAASGEMSLLGPVNGQLNARAGKVTINNSVKGAVEIKAAEKLFIGSKAVFGDNAKYKSTQEAQVEGGATLGGLQFEKMTEKEASGKNNTGFIAGIITLGFVIKLLAVIVTAFVIHRLFRRGSLAMIQNLDSHFLMNLLVGFITFIAAPILGILLLVSIVGFYIGLILFVLWVLFFLLSGLLGTIYIGSWIVKKLGKKPELVIDWQAIVIGVVVVGVAGLIPILGFIFVAVLFLAGMGTLATKFYHAIKNDQGEVSITA